MNIQIKITGVKELGVKFDKLADSLGDLSDEMDETGKALKEYYASVGFASQGTAFGKPWPRLSTKYAVAKAKKYPGAGILIATGDMQKSFVHEYNKTSTTITNSDPKFKYHQSSEPRVKLPRRQTMGVNRVVRETINDIMNEGINNKIKRLGLK